MPRRLSFVLCVVKILLFVSFLILTTSGCDKKKAESDHESDFLKYLISHSGDDVDLKQRAQLAMSKLEDGIMDPEPFLIHAIMKTSRVEDGERMFLTLIMYDEDEDYIGFVVEEECVDSNNIVTTRLVEKYPAFKYSSYSNYLDFMSIPVLVRDENKRKPEEQWLKYMNTPRQQQKEEYMKRSKKNWTWKDTIPPVWLSIPEPGKLNIYVRVYDRAGHISERVRMVYSQKKWPSEDNY